MTARRALTLLLLAGTGPALAAQTRVWDCATDFVGGVGYGVALSSLSTTVAATDVNWTLAPRQEYQPDDPLQAPGSSPYWRTSNAVPLHGLPYALIDHQVVRVGNRLYVLGGCQDTNHPSPDPPFLPTCAYSGLTTVASVYFTEIAPNGDLPFSWTKCAQELGQVAGAPTGSKRHHHRAVAVDGWIYVAGGSTENCSKALPGELPTTTDVFAAHVDPVTGQTGPWTEEIKLGLPLADHMLVYAAGALYALGGYVDGSATPNRQIYRAQIKPDGHLGSNSIGTWDAVAALPTPITNENAVACPCCTMSNCLSGACVEPSCDAQCQGYIRGAPFSFMRTLGFYGAAYVGNPFTNACLQFTGVMHAYLDDCNVPAVWESSGPTDMAATYGASCAFGNGSILLAGGESGSGIRPNVVYNSAGTPGMYRDHGTDRDELKPALPDNTQMLNATSGDAHSFPGTSSISLARVPMATWNDGDPVAPTTWVYAVGGAIANGSSSCASISRTRLAAVGGWVSAGSWVSPAYDLGPGNHRLTRVAWAGTQYGIGSADAWMTVRYRVADESGTWSCWTPRIPEEAGVSQTPGYVVFATDAPTILRREALITSTMRYLQYEVNLYNDDSNDLPGPPTLPKFDRFEATWEDVVVVERTSCQLDVFPNPVDRTLTLRFEAAPEGALVTAEIYNAAGDLALRHEFPLYLTGGVKTEVLPVGNLANGAYVVIARGVSRGGSGGLHCTRTDESFRSLKGKFVVRRR